MQKNEEDHRNNELQAFLDEKDAQNQQNDI